MFQYAVINYICILTASNMSKLSPYRATQAYKRDSSPLAAHLDSTPGHQGQRHYKQSQPLHNVYTKYLNRKEQSNYSYKPTEKKKQDLDLNYDLQNILQKNRSLASQNGQLYQMLEERGRIITALEKKLQEQMYREVQTLEEIEQEKNKFIDDSHKKFKEYQMKIEQLIQEVYLLNEEKYQLNMIKARQIDIIKDSFSKEQTIKMHEMARQHLSFKGEQQEFEQNQVKTLLQLKNKEIEEITCEYQQCIQQLKTEIGELTNQIVQINHLRKIELSEQKIIHDHMIENMAKESSKERELLSIEHDLLVKKLEQLLVSKELEAAKLGELVKVGQIELSVREQELMQKKSKLQEEVRDLQEFYRNKSFKEALRLKELNYSEISALEKGTSAISGNLREQISNLVHLNNTKTQQIGKLHAQIDTQRTQSREAVKKLQRVIEELKSKMKELKSDHCCQLQNLKVKWAELCQADLSTLKNYHQKQMELLQQQLLEKMKEVDYNRKKLYEQLQGKNEMRKRHDLEKVNLEKRITELQLFIKELVLTKREEVSKISSDMHMTSSKLLREATDKEKANLSNEEEKKKLQELITSKDKEIEQLNQKIRLMRENYSNEIAQKNAELQIIKKHKLDLEVELRKENSFFDSQLKKKDSILKSTKEGYETEISVIKDKFKQEYDSVLNDLTSKIYTLEVEINRLRTAEKGLKQQISVLKQSQSTEIGDKVSELQFQRERHENEKKTVQDNLKKYYVEQINKLEHELSDVKRQLAYKEEDIRTMSDHYHKLQKKMEAVMESQNQLRKIQKDILDLGLNNNRVNNLVQAINLPQLE